MVPWPELCQDCVTSILCVRKRLVTRRGQPVDREHLRRRLGVALRMLSGTRTESKEWCLQSGSVGTGHKATEQCLHVL